MDASTASLVAIMDFRGFASSTGPEEHQEAYNNSFRELATRLPNLRCLLLDEHPQLNLSMLSKHAFRSSTIVPLDKIHLISIANCGTSLPARFFGGQWLIGLVYLDMSNTPGTLGNQGALMPNDLPYLRILKLRSKSLTDLTAGGIVREFGTQLWSLDVSRNSLSDKFLRMLVEYSLPTYSNTRLQSNNHFSVEGQIRPVYNNGQDRANRGLYFVDESEWSATFSSADRYLADPPVYGAMNGAFAGEEGSATVRGRSQGRERIRGDSAQDAVQVLAGAPGEEIPDALHPQHQRLHWPHPRAGTTHLHLNELNISASAVKRLLRESPGYIEHFECDRAFLPSHHIPIWQSKAPYLSKAATLFALPGAAYLFRPAISSNLRVLKVHHSLITNTPTLESRSTGELTNLWLAETYIRERLDLAYPQTFVPDMNPRLYSLTISMTPRYSTGIVAQRLIDFLRLAALQEQAIERTRALLPFRGPPVLKGLRHVRLEFEPDAKDELGSLENDPDGLDSEGLLEQGTEAFSFFSESAWGPSSSPVKSKVKRQAAGEATEATEAQDADTKEVDPAKAEKIDDCPFSKASGEHINFTINPAGENSQLVELVVSVWVGSGVISPENPPAVNEYMRNVCDPVNRASASPATPCHVAGGVPAGSFIFERAWDSIMLPAAASELKLPTKAELRGMEDVVARVKAFRLESRRQYAALDAARRNSGGHEYWRGRLEIVLPQGRAHSSDYWR
ncbi:hypothetical protein diail_4821 [Diaporthe ilicicola]|nr:hypothetical protein diail_4821 [Diaporthe ilicicola]